MGYVIAAIIVLLLVAGFVTFFVLNATKRSGKAGPGDPPGRQPHHANNDSYTQDEKGRGTSCALHFWSHPRASSRSS